MSWPTMKLGEVAEIVSGATPKTGKPEFWDGDIPWVTPKDLSELGQKYLSSTPRKITEKGLKSCAATMLPPQSVLFSSRAPIGLVAINSISVATNQGFKSFVPNNEKLVSGYLYWWLKANREKIANLGRGATFKEVSKAIVQGIEIPLPPLDEQKRIAALLDAADALRAKRRESIEQLDKLAQSVFIDMFGDPVTNPKGWNQVPMGSIAEINPPLSKEFRPKSDDEVTFVPMAAVSDESREIVEILRKPFSEVSKGYTQFRRGDILVAKITPCFENGKMAYAKNIPTQNASGSTEFHVIRPHHDFMSEMIFTLLQLPHVRAFGAKKMKGAAGQRRVPVEFFSKLKIPLVEEKLAVKFSQIINSIKQKKDTSRLHLDELDSLFASLQSRAFSGSL